MINVWLKNFTDKNFKPTEEGWKKALKKFLPNYKLDSKFFSENGKLRKDLTEAQFEEWQNYWFENLIGCKDFACVHDSETCGIARMCGDCSIYRTYKNGTFYSDGKTVTDWCDQVNHLSFDKKTGKWSLGLKDWEKEFPKKACYECTGRSGLDSVDEKEFAAKVISSELDKAFRSRQEFICPDLKKVLEEYKHVRGSKNNRQYEMCGSWCKEYNDFYEKQGFIVDRWNERYGDDKGARTLLFSVGEKNFLEFRKAIDSGEFYKTIMEFSAKIHLPKGVRDKLDKVLEERGLKK